MRKARDYDAELKALESRAKALRARKIEQLGQLVIATGADALDTETLAGALLQAIDPANQANREALHARGAAFFQNRQRKTTLGPDHDNSSPDQGSAGDAQA